MLSLSFFSLAYQKLRRLDATKSWSRSVLPPQALLRQARRQKKNYHRAAANAGLHLRNGPPSSTLLPYLRRLALNNPLHGVNTDVLGDDGSNSKINSSTSYNSDNSSSDGSCSNLAPRRQFTAVAGPLHATSANAEMGDSKLHSARIIAQPHAFVAALPRWQPQSSASADKSNTHDGEELQASKGVDAAVGAEMRGPETAATFTTAATPTSSTDPPSPAADGDTIARLDPVLESGGGGALGDLLRGQSAQRPPSSSSTSKTTSTSRWPSVAAVLQRERGRLANDDHEEKEKAAAAAVGNGRGPALLRALLDQVMCTCAC